MKYQKSMMRVLEKILHSREGEPIGRLIAESHTGRNATFNAVKWLEKNGFVEVKFSGRQKIVKPVLDDYTLQYKYYLDSVEFKSFDPFIKMVIKIFVNEIKGNKIRAAVLFGSVLNKKDYHDVDILLLGDKLGSNDMKSLSGAREKIERVFGVVVNLHKGDLGVESMFRGVVVYQSSFIRSLDKAQKQYLEFLDWAFESIKNQNDLKIFKVSFENAVVNLSYAYSHAKGFNPRTKSDAVHFFNKNNKLTNLDELKKEGVRIGKGLFK